MLNVGTVGGAPRCVTVRALTWSGRGNRGPEAERRARRTLLAGALVTVRKGPLWVEPPRFGVRAGRSGTDIAHPRRRADA